MARGDARQAHHVKVPRLVARPARRRRRRQRQHEQQAHPFQEYNEI